MAVGEMQRLSAFLRHACVALWEERVVCRRGSALATWQDDDDAWGRQGVGGRRRRSSHRLPTVDGGWPTVRGRCLTGRKQAGMQGQGWAAGKNQRQTEEGGGGVQ